MHITSVPGPCERVSSAAKGSRHEQVYQLVGEAGLILTENILDHIQGVDAPDIVAKGPLMMRANPCAARLPGSGAAVGRAATRGHGSEHLMFFCIFC